MVHLDASLPTALTISPSYRLLCVVHLRQSQPAPWRQLDLTTMRAAIKMRRTLVLFSQPTDSEIRLNLASVLTGMFIM